MVADGECGSGFFAAAPAYDAALDVLGDWGSDRDWLTHLPTPPASPSASADTDNDASPTQRPPADARTHYRRKRDSRDAKRVALLQEIEQLARQLDDEKKRFPVRAQPLTGDALALSREWSQMAARQRRQRHAAEQRQNELRDLYHSQAQTARQIRRVLEKAMRVEMCLAAPTSETVTIADYCGPTLDISAHMAYLDGLIRQAHCVTASGVFAQLGGAEFREVRVRDAAEEGIQVDFVAEFLLPFSAPRVADAIWAESIHMEHTGRLVDHEHSLLNSTVLVSSFVSAPDGTGTPGSNHGQAVAGTTHGQTALRRFHPTQDGSIWILSMNHARILGRDGKTSGFMNGDGWVCVEPVRRPSNPQTVTRDVCRVKWCHRMHGRPLGHEAASRDERARWAYGAVTKQMRQLWTRDFEGALQAIENVLVSPSTTTQ